MRRSSGSRPTASGFTLLELIFTIVLLGVLATFAIMKLSTPGTMTVYPQAQAAAEAVRRAQTLAMVRGQRTSVAVTAGANGSVTVACVASAPCATDSTHRLSQGVDMG